MRLLIACCLLVTMLCVCAGASPGLNATSPSNETEGFLPEGAPGYAREAWIRSDKQLRNTMNKIVRKALPYVTKEVYKKDLSPPCMATLLQAATALRQTKAWIFRMLDASGRFPEGFLSGTLIALGHYDECVQIRVNETRLRLQGQYCLLELVPPAPAWRPFTSMHQTLPELANISTPDSLITHLMGMLQNVHVTTTKIGLCTPSPCTTEDIHKLVQIVPEQLGLEWKFSVNHCEVQEPTRFTTPQWIVLALLCVVAVAVVLSSLADVLGLLESVKGEGGSQAFLRRLASAFSFPANARRLSGYSCPQDPLAFTHGIMFIVFYWVAIANTFMYVNYDVTSNFEKAFEIVQEFFFEIALNRLVPLQALFFLSGLITTYRWLSRPEKLPSVWRFLLRRYWRYTPAYALVIALMIIAPTWGSGPTWSSRMDPIYNNCRDNWWQNLLYINNFMDSSRVCLDHTWVLAVDAQLHVIAIFMLVPLKLRPRIGLAVTSALGLAGLAAVGLANVYLELPPNEALAYLHARDRNFYADHSYHRVYTHLIQYCAGVLVAYFMSTRPNFKVSKACSRVLWLLSLVLILGTCLAVDAWGDGQMPDPLNSALYATLGRVAQAAFLSWVAIACMTGMAGGLRDVLSWRPFSFLARLLFIGYIMYVPITTLINAAKKTPMFVSKIELFYVVLNHVSGTLVVAYVLFACFEAPFLALSERRGASTVTVVEETKRRSIAKSPAVQAIKRGENA